MCLSVNMYRQWAVQVGVFVAMHHMDSRETMVTSGNNNSTSHHEACIGSLGGVHV